MSPCAQLVTTTANAITILNLPVHCTENDLVGIATWSEH